MKSKKSAQEIQDEIFQKMPFAKKIKVAFNLTTFLLKLNRLNGNRKTSAKNHPDIRRA